MKSTNFEFKSLSCLIMQVCVLFVLCNCNNVDENFITEVEESMLVTDSWIASIESFEEDAFQYIDIHMFDSGDYLALSSRRMLKVSKDGILNSINFVSYPDDNMSHVKIYNNKIFRFHYDNDYQYYDPAAPVEVQIYDFDFNLLSEHVLDTNGIPYDVEVENEELFAILVYDVDNRTMRIKKIHLTNGLMVENVLSTSGPNPVDVQITEAGDYLCTNNGTARNLFLLDQNLNVLWENEFGNFLIKDAKYVAGRGI